MGNELGLDWAFDSVVRLQKGLNFISISKKISVLAFIYYIIPINLVG